MFILRFFLKIIFSLLLGAGLALAWFQYDERFVAMANERMEKIFEGQLHCRFRGTIKRVRPFSLTIEFEKVRVTPLDLKKEWAWQAETMVIYLSPLYYFYNKAVGLNTYLRGVRAQSLIKNGLPTVTEHLQDLFAGPDLGVPITSQSVVIDTGFLQMHDKQGAVSFRASWNSQSYKAQSVFESTFVLSNTALTLDKKELFKDLSGVLKVDALDRNQGVALRTDVSFLLPQLKEEQQRCYLVGTWDKDVGNFALHNSDRSFSFLPIRVLLRNGNPYIAAEGTFSFDYIKKLLFPFITDQMGGACFVKVAGDLSDGLQGDMRVYDIAYGKTLLDRLTASFVRRNKAWHGTVSGSQGKAKVTGLWDWSEVTKRGSVVVTNRTELALSDNSYWACVPRKTSLKAQWNQYGFATIGYATTVRHKKTEQEINSCGTIKAEEQTVALEGFLNNCSYSCSFLRDPFELVSFVYNNEQQQELLKITTAAHDHSRVTACMEYDVLRSLLEMAYDVSLPGEGQCTVEGVWRYPLFDGCLQFTKGTVRLAGMYNFMSGFTARVLLDAQQCKATFLDTRVQFHQGDAKSTQATVAFDGSGTLRFAHVPFQFYRCFLNWEKYGYAMSSGALVFQADAQEKSSLKGFVTLDAAQFKENIFAKKTQQGFLHTMSASSAVGYNVDIDIALSTGAPLVINTPELQTHADIEILAQNSMRHPELYGTIVLRGGKLHFPAKELAISRGKITFVPHQTDDPFLELIAQGRIKRYLITLSIGGSAQDPQVTLQSVPALSEEQIIMLLLTGSEHESLNVMVPALVMRNIESIIFGSAHALGLKKSSWFSSLKKIAFVPRFTDQTGRGGLKGALEIEVSKRLRAVLEKNFSLSEDTTIEVEYLVSDDVSLRMTRDERGDMGAEVEMRFKF